MNAKSIELECSFTSGSEDYLFMGPYEDLKVDKTEHQNTIISTYVLMTSGCYFESGSANVNNNIVTLTYKSCDNGSICFEQYSCEICFTIPTASLPVDPVFILTKEHQSRAPAEEPLLCCSNYPNCSCHYDLSQHP